MIDQYGNEISWIPNIEDSNKPKYLAIVDAMEKDISEGILSGGFRLPPQRIIANYLNINHSTVTRAYKLCEEKGLIKGITGKGTFVTSYAGIPQSLLTNIDNNRVIDLGMILSLQEMNPLVESFIKEITASTNYSEILKHMSPEGTIKHRFIASRFLSKYYGNIRPENIAITSGIQNSLAVILSSVFKKGDRIIVDEYTYTGLINLAKMLGIILIPIKSGVDGIDIEEFRFECEKGKSKGVYLIPDCHNPSTSSFSIDKRKEVAEIIKNNNLLLIEDSTFVFTTKNTISSISSFAVENSFYLSGFSKLINPAFRIGFLAFPKKYKTVIRNAINSLTWMASPLNAEIITQIISSEKYSYLLNQTLENLELRNKLFDDILGDYDIYPSTHSLFRYMVLDEHISGEKFEKKCIQEGVQIFSSKRFAVASNSLHNSIRLSLTGTEDTSELKKGLNIIKNLLIS